MGIVYSLVISFKFFTNKKSCEYKIVKSKNEYLENIICNQSNECQECLNDDNQSWASLELDDIDFDNSNFANEIFIENEDKFFFYT